jgi:wobble nucleotide-excising tRNase
MLTKTLLIRNIGRFDFSAPVELAQATLIYAENGRGKTTLAAILRSLQTGEPLHILERKTIGSQDVPSVAFLANINSKNSQHSFDGQVWSTTLADCEIFDSAFIAQNIYSGSEIDPDHRRSLHKFVLGAANVALAKEVDELDDKIRAATQRITESELTVQKLCLDGYSLDEFIKLSSSPNIDQDISAQESIVEAARGAATIAATQGFLRVPTPQFARAAWDDTLATTLADLESAAEEMVRSHVETHLSPGSETWLADGLSYLKGDTCPFCATSVGANDLVRAYQAVFSTAYDELKQVVAQATNDSAAALAQSALDGVRKNLQTNRALAPIWSAHGIACPPPPALPVAEIALIQLESDYSAAFSLKSANVLEARSVHSDIAEAWSAIQNVSELLTRYNSEIVSANSRIDEVKAIAATNSLPGALSQLRELRNRRARCAPAAVSAVKGLAEAKEAKKVLEAEKKKAKAALDEATATLFRDYQYAINEHLKNCACGYSITGTKTVYPGGKPRTDYQLVINNQSVELSTPRTGSAPCFKNTLSDGDKSTLAFAFFLARLGLDGTLEGKIVVLDDPMTSLDAHRRNYTCQQIVRLAGKCRQLILLTHDALFARKVWDDLPKQKKALCIADKSNRSFLAEWDILTATQSEYFERYERIHVYVSEGEGDPLTAAVSLRLVLEGNLRMRFPNEFRPTEWLGQFINKIRESKSGELLWPMQGSLNELTSINDYAKQFHHDQNPTAANTAPNSAELKAYGRRVLAFAAGTPYGGASISDSANALG